MVSATANHYRSMMMNTWFVYDAGDPLFAEDPLERIRQVFAAQRQASGGKEDMAIFFRHENEGGPHCRVQVYFSPAAAGAAREVNAVPCAAPARRGLGMLAGTPAAWQVLFPG